MYLIYGKNTVAQAVARLCDHVGISYEMHDDSDGKIDLEKYEAIIPSPGVPSSHPIYASGKVIAELDFAYQFLPKGFRISAVTGTDGKSTTAWMLYSILQKEFSGKKRVFISGNFEIPFSGTVLDILKKGEKKGEIVVEVSSFMAYWIGKSSLPPFTPDYTIFTNLKTDHLNWHHDLQEYRDAKMNLVQHTAQKSILNTEILDFTQEQGLQGILPENIRFFSSESTRTPRDWTDGEHIAISGRRKYSLHETQFTGLHNALNLLAVTLVTNEMKICSRRTKKYLQEITGLSHRLEKIGEKQGILMIDDSKSTSAQSLEAALGSFGNSKNLLLIVGGSDKGDAFDHLAEIVAHRVKAMACIGATKDAFIHIAQSKKIPHLSTDNLSEAVNFLFERGSVGDVLLLSPGCASFGLFRDYLDRAHQFRDAIQKLPN